MSGWRRLGRARKGAKPKLPFVSVEGESREKTPGRAMNVPRNAPPPSRLQRRPTSFRWRGPHTKPPCITLIQTPFQQRSAGMSTYQSPSIIKPQRSKWHRTLSKRGKNTTPSVFCVAGSARHLKHQTHVHGPRLTARNRPRGILFPLSVTVQFSYCVHARGSHSALRTFT